MSKITRPVICGGKTAKRGRYDAFQPSIPEVQVKTERTLLERLWWDEAHGHH